MNTDIRKKRAIRHLISLSKSYRSYYDRDMPAYAMEVYHEIEGARKAYNICGLLTKDASWEIIHHIVEID